MKRRATLLPLLLAATVGCHTTPLLVPPSQQHIIPRTLVDYPPGFELRPLIKNLTAPTAITFDADRNLIVAAGGVGGTDVHLFAYRPDGKRLDIYPPAQRLPLFNTANFDLRGPVGGIVADKNLIYVSHRDRHDRGTITAFSLDGSHHTLVRDLPAQGEYSVTDLAINPANGRLYFGVGAATNAGVVGTDDWDWVHDHPDFCDQSAVDLKLLGYRFDTPNPFSGIFGTADIAVTAPYHPFAYSKRLRVPRAPHPTAAVYSVNPTDGSDLRVESTGIRNPVGLQFNEFGRLFMTNQGMQLRGTRPVANDPDALLWLVPGVWYGWPDFSADLQPISDKQFQPPESLIVRTGYPELSPLLDHETSGLIRPDRTTLLRAAFPPNAGAAKLDFAPDTGPYKPFHGQALVALSGDRAPFANANQPLPDFPGYKIVRVDVETRQVFDFIHNTTPKPASEQDHADGALERPTDLKFSPDGTLYIVDLGELQSKHGQPQIKEGTGRILILTPTPTPTPPTRHSERSEESKPLESK